MEFKNIQYVIDNGIITVTINRPKALNALNPETIHELGQCVGMIESNTDIKVVIITGGGTKSFVAGADIVAMSTMNPIEGRTFGMLAQDVFTRIENLPQPVIAAINGYALGIASKGTIAVNLSKAAINRGINCDVITGIAYEAEVFGLCFATEDQKEGMQAFVEKRKAVFKGK